MFVGPAWQRLGGGKVGGSGRRLHEFGNVVGTASDEIRKPARLSCQWLAGWFGWMGMDWFPPSYILNSEASFKTKVACAAQAR